MVDAVSRAPFERWRDDSSTWPVSGFAERHAHAIAAGAPAGAQIASMRIGSDPLSTILQLRARGVVVALAADGGIAIDPASALNATDLATLNNLEHRRAIAAAHQPRRHRAALQRAVSKRNPPRLAPARPRSAWRGHRRQEGAHRRRGPSSGEIASPGWLPRCVRLHQGPPRSPAAPALSMECHGQTLARGVPLDPHIRLGESRRVADVLGGEPLRHGSLISRPIPHCHRNYARPWARRCRAMSIPHNVRRA
jgi:hypothetical protein